VDDPDFVGRDIFTDSSCQRSRSVLAIGKIHNLGSQTKEILWEIAPQPMQTSNMPAIVLSPRMGHQSLYDATNATFANFVPEVKNWNFIHLIIPWKHD
jgi:hypothetical protein